jgi:dipeptidyl aminopeptidase/acylaminoacyl peptidase
MSMDMKPVLVAFVLGLTCATPAAAQSRMDLDAYGRIVRLADPQIAPDGRSVVLTVSRADFEENRYDADLVQVDVASGRTRPLTSQRRGVGQPRWSASGDRLAFLAAGPAAPGREARAQVFVLPMSGGDARRVTDAPNGVQHFAWAPDGATIAFATADEPEKKSGIERHNRSFEIGNDDFLVQDAPMPTHIWLISSDGSAPARRITSGSWSLPTSFPPGPPASPLSWSADGKSIAFTRVDTPHSGDFDRARVHIADVATGRVRALTGREKFEGHPVFSPDGSRVAFWRPRGVDSANVTEIQIAPATGGEGTSITGALDRNMARALWMPDSGALLVGANDATKVSLWLQPAGGAARKLQLGDVSPASSFWVDVNVGRDGAIAFVGTTTTRPAELYYLSSTTAAPRRLTDLNAPTASLALGRTEVIEWQSDGFQHNGILTYPPDYQPGRKYPLVLVIHGGPRAASLETFGAQAQLFAARGWVIFQPNYRGSDQLGQTYQKTIVNDAGAGPGRDVMAGLAAVKARGFVDESRIAVSGWSYGGYMTTWLIGNYPSGWRAAMAGAPVTDNLDQYNLGDANVRRAYAFGGSPWTSPERMKAFMDQSPISYASKIRTPTLIMHNMGDYRVTPTQAFKLYHALKDNGVETQFVGYPLRGHNAADPVHQRDVQRRWMGWIAQHFGVSASTAAQ